MRPQPAGRAHRLTGPLRSVADAERRAARVLPPSVRSALRAGSERGVTAAANASAFAQLGLAPRALGAAKRDQSTVVLGQQLSLPVLLSPLGVQAVHPAGEVAVARAAAARGTALGLSCFASRPVEQVAATGAPTLVQIHWAGGRSLIAEVLERARAAGAVGLVATLDWSFSEGRDAGSPHLPSALTWREKARFAPEAVRHPHWLVRWSHGLPDLRLPGMPGNPTFFGFYETWRRTPPPTWDDVAWLRSVWEGPLVLKGVCRVDDARRAVDAGVTAVSVSNHGGNNLDTTPASIRCLPAVAAAVGDQVEVLLDGGIRYGTDVVKALALGARAVLLGRPYVWGLAARGQAGVEEVLDALRREVDVALLGLGRASTADLDRSDVIVPTGFELAL